MSTITPLHFQGHADLLPRRPVVELLERLGRTARGRPGRQKRGQRRTPRQVGVRIERDVTSAAAGSIDQREELGRAAFVVGEVEGGVREVWPSAARQEQSRYASTYGRGSRCPLQFATSLHSSQLR